MNASEIKLVGTTFDTNTDDPKWWDYELEQGRIVAQIEKKNAFKLQPIFEKIAEQGVHKMHVPFSGGGDCGGFDGNIIFYDKKDKEIEVNYSKLKADHWRENYIPLIHKVPTKTKGKSTCHIFEYQYTDYKDYDVTEDWLVQRFYEFGFLNEWGSFAGEYHVSGVVKIWPKTGAWQMPYSQSVEEYDEHEQEGSMFDEAKNDN
jgi:hypothetical protein